MSGRKATIDIRPGQYALSVGNPNTPAPRGWRWIELNKVARMATGHTPSRRKPEYWGGDIPWISVRDARPYHGKAISTTHENINPLGIKHSAAVLLPENTVCLSRTGSIGYAILLSKQMATSQGFVNWICSKELMPRFLQLIFVSENSFLHSISEGVAHTTIYFPEAKAFHVCIPDIEQQKIIITKIEELFSELDKAVENLRLAQQQLKTYKQAVLKWAFESRLSNKKSDSGITNTNWKRTSLGQMGSLFCGQSSPSNEVNFDKQGTLYVTGPEQWNGVSIEKTKWTMKPKRIVPDGSIFITVKGAGVGKMFPGICCAIGRDVYAFLPNEGLDFKFAYYVIKRSIDSIISKAKGDIPGLSKNHILDHEIPVCSITEQKKIVSNIEAQLSVADKFDESIKDNLQRTRSLRQSILKKAFEGKLV